MDMKLEVLVVPVSGVDQAQPGHDRVAGAAFAWLTADHQARLSPAPTACAAGCEDLASSVVVTHSAPRPPRR